MRFLDHLTIRTKLLGGFGITTLLLIAGTLLGYLASRTIADNLVNFYSQQLTASNQSTVLAAAADRIHANLLAGIQSKTGTPSALAAIAQDNVVMQDVISALKKEKKTTAMTQVIDAWQLYQVDLKTVVSNLQTKDAAQAFQISEGYLQNSAKFNTSISDWQEELQAGQSASSNDVNSIISWLMVIILAGGALGILTALGLGFVLSRNISQPLKAFTANMQQISQGKLHTPESHIVRQVVSSRGDELGILGQAINQIEAYLETSANAAHEISSGNLAVEIQLRSSQDQLGSAMTVMVEQLNYLVGKVTTSSRQVEKASVQLTQAAQQTNLGSAQISTTIKQVVNGIIQQNSDLDLAKDVFEKTSQTIERVSTGVNDQSQAITKIDQIASSMNSAIREVNQNIQTVVDAANLSTRNANEGAATVKSTLTSMDHIQTQVETLEEKVTAMSTRSGEINGILGTIEDIAIKTNILAINATIEAAHAKTQVKTLTENVLNQMMISQCEMAGRMLILENENLNQAFWEQLGKATSLDTLLITDDDGVVEICNEASLVGWRFPDDPKSQTAPFRKLIHQQNGIYCQESQPRSLDHQLFKYVGITRLDKPGIIQVGFKMDTLVKFDVQIDGFAVVAEEVYKLADQSHAATREIRSLISGIQAAIKEANQAMRISREGVETSRQQADQAGKVLENILLSVKDVYGQAQSAFSSTHRIQDLATTLNSTIATVSTVINLNASAADEMSVSYLHVAQAMEGIAGLSLQNSALAQEVSSATEEMREQTQQVQSAAESLSKLAGSLEQAVQQFHLN